MGQRGVHFALHDEQLERLMEAADDESRLGVMEEIEDEWDELFLHQTDKAWDALHRSFTDGKLEYDNGQFPLSHVILGGQQLYEGDDFILSYKSPHQVVQIAAALADFNTDELHDRYFAIDGEDHGPEWGKEDFDYTLGWLDGLTEFYERAAQNRRAVIFSVDN